MPFSPPRARRLLLSAVATAALAVPAVAASPPGLQPVVDGQLIEPGYLDVARRVAEAARWPRLA